MPGRNGDTAGSRRQKVKGRILLVDPDARRVECHRLAGQVFERIAEEVDDATLAVADFAGLVLPLPGLWADSEAPARR